MLVEHYINNEDACRAEQSGFLLRFPPNLPFINLFLLLILIIILQSYNLGIEQQTLVTEV